MAFIGRYSDFCISALSLKQFFLGIVWLVFIKKNCDCLLFITKNFPAVTPTLVTFSQNIYIFKYFNFSPDIVPLLC